RRAHFGPKRADVGGPRAGHEPHPGDPHDHSAPGIDPDASRARLPLRLRREGQRDRLGDRRAGAPASDPGGRRQYLPPVRALHGSDARLLPALLSGRPRRRPDLSPPRAPWLVMTLDWDVVWSNLPRFWDGALMTI